MLGFFDWCRKFVKPQSDRPKSGNAAGAPLPQERHVDLKPVRHTRDDALDFTNSVMTGLPVTMDGKITATSMTGSFFSGGSD